MKYRIKKISYVHNEAIFIAQYKALGVWMTMDNNYVGHFYKLKGKCVCESFEEAKQRIERLKRAMNRSRWAFSKKSEIVYQTED